MQKAKYDIGEEAVNRFSLPPEDKATLELAEWVDSAFGRASVCSLSADCVSVNWYSVQNFYIFYKYFLMYPQNVCVN